ncbi:MAG: histidine kinase [Kineosporiaceae bacterium]
MGAARRTRAAFAVLWGRRALARWTYLVLGGALLMPYVMTVGATRSGLTGGDRSLLDLPALVPDALLASPLVALTGLMPTVGTLETSAVRALLDPRVIGGARLTWADRGRGALWFALHLFLGGLVSGLTLAAPVVAAIFLVLPVQSLSTPLTRAGAAPGGWWGPPAGVGSFVAISALAALVAAGLARCAPALLGPSTADRLSAFEQERDRAQAANRIAGELHDSLGHTLSVVTLQAAAARDLLDRDPAFVRRALEAIEDSTRTAVGELDRSLSVLRGDRPPATGAPTLADVGALVDRSRAGGAEIDLRVSGDLARVHPAVSRQAYRVVQESLTNALRHGGTAPVLVELTAATGSRELPASLQVRVTNPFVRVPRPPTAHRSAGQGRRGLEGLAQRVSALDGTFHAGPHGEGWQVLASFPAGSR